LCYEIRSVANGHYLNVLNGHELCTTASLSRWCIVHQCSDVYTVALAYKGLGIQHSENGHVTIAGLNDEASQLWTFEPFTSFFNNTLKVSRLTVTEPNLRKHNESWLLVHRNAGPYPVQYIVTGNYSSGVLYPCAAAVMIDILAVRKVPSCPDDVYLPSVGGGHRGMVVDPTKAQLIYRHTKDIPHAGVWSLGVPPVNNEICGRTLCEEEFIACYVHLWTSRIESIGLWVDCALYYTDKRRH